MSRRAMARLQEIIAGALAGIGPGRSECVEAGCAVVIEAYSDVQSAADHSGTSGPRPSMSHSQFLDNPGTMAVATVKTPPQMWPRISSPKLVLLVLLARKAILVVVVLAGFVCCAVGGDFESESTRALGARLVSPVPPGEDPARA